MSRPRREPLTRLEQGCEVLRGAGIKVTHQRLEILREVLAGDEHPDAERVYRGVRERMPSISLDTVYRTLWLFGDLRLITPMGTSGERLRFDTNPLPHHHFVCTQCGTIGDFTSPQFDQLTVPDAVSALGVVARVQVEFRGLCHVCASASAEAAEAGTQDRE